MSTSTGAASLVMTELSPTVDRVVETVRSGGLAGAPTDVLAATVRDLRRVQSQLAWVVLQAVREVDVSGGHVSDGALTPASWLRQHLRMGLAEASATVRTARGLSGGSLDATSRALSAGEIDTGHAQAIALGAEDAPPGAVALIEEHALHAARVAPPVAVSGLMRRFREALDPDGADGEAVRRYDRRGVSAATTIDGMVSGRFLLDPAVGSGLLTALDAGAPLTAGDTRSPAQRRADGLAAIVSHFLGSADLPLRTGARPHVILTRLTSPGDDAARDPGPRGGEGAPGCNGQRRPGGADDRCGHSSFDVAEALSAALAGDAARLSWVGPVSEGTAERVACDARVTVVGVDPDGEARDSGTRRRYFTWSQRTAMIARDGDQCPWPWCDRPIWWSDGHHLRSWQDGGPTTTANGALPCEGHHVLLHEGHWTLVRLRDGRYLARHRGGRVIGPEPSRRPRGFHPPPHRRE